MKRLHVLGSFFLVLWVALLPLQTRFIPRQGFMGGGVWEYGTISIYLTDILLVAAVLLIAIARPRQFWKKPRALPTIVLAAVCGVVLIAFFSVLQAVDVGVALGAFLRLLVAVLAWWVVATSSIRVAWFAIAIVASAAVEGVLAMAQFFLQHIAGSSILGIAEQASSTLGVSVVETTAGRFVRAYGTLPHPNMLAGWLVLGLVIAVGLYLRSKDKLERSVILMAFLLIQAGLFLTFSRGAMLSWFAVFIFLCVVIMVRERKNRAPLGWLPSRQRHPFLGMKMLKLIIAGVLGIGMFTLIYSPLVATRTGAVGRLETMSLEQRADQLSDVKHLARDHWLFGAGIGNYTKALHDEVDSRRESWAYQPVHNVSLLVCIELGALGALVLLWATAMIVDIAFVKGAGIWRRRNESVIPWLGFLSLALLAVLIMSFFDHYFWSLPFGILCVFMVLGLWTRSLTAEE